MDFATQKVIELLPPAIIVSAAVYLVRFFGKIIVDQSAFQDDRNWGIEVAGLLFFVNLVVVPGALAFALVHYVGALWMGHWMHFLGVSILTAWLIITTTLLLEKTYQIKLPLVPMLVRMPEDSEDYQAFKRAMLKADKYNPLWLIALLLSYLAILEYQSGSIVWTIFIGGEIFFCFIFMAINYSLRTQRLAKADIYTLGNPEPMRDVTLLKINDDNVRFRDGDTVVLFNKSQILKIEQRLKLDQDTKKEDLLLKGKPVK
jgi:hypothetical protein